MSSYLIISCIPLVCSFKIILKTEKYFENTNKMMLINKNINPLDMELKGK